MSGCRNCAGNDLQDLGPIGKVAPFFLKRALGLELGRPVSANPLKQKIREFTLIPMSPVPRLSTQFAFVEMQICHSCSFIQTSRPFHDEDILRLYRDYRSPSYNQERIKFEPSYATIASRVGQDEIEIHNRRAALSEFLHQNLGSNQPRTILDYGGSDGRFIPDIAGRKYVFEISNIEPIPEVTRIHSETDLGTYSLVLLAHVIEHVPHPLSLVQKIAAFVEPGGFLYIETPQEISDEERVGLQDGTRRFHVEIHEHINSYCVPAVSRLFEKAGLQLVAVERSSADVGWTKATHIRALGQKRT